MRLRQIQPEYEGRVKLRTRAFPLEIAGTKGVPRDILEQEWWLAALQEPSAEFKPFAGDWPTSTLPAFEAAWCAAQQGDEIGHEFDLRLRRAFFAQGRNIERREVLFDVARETGLNMNVFTRAFESGAPREAVLAEHRLGREQYRVRGTPTVMLADGTHLRHPIAFPRMRDRRIVGIAPLPCCGKGCLDATRALFERTLGQG